MARNEEKAMAALNRWTAQKRDLERSKSFGKATYMGGALPDAPAYGPYAQKKRPKIASEVTTVKECEHWRSEILRGVAKKIGEIQNAALGEHRIRDLNDEINKDLREKGYWEDQIKNLGGPDFKALAPKDVETYGAELPLTQVTSTSVQPKTFLVLGNSLKLKYQQRLLVKLEKTFSKTSSQTTMAGETKRMVCCY